MKKLLATIYLIVFLAASGGSGIYFATSSATKPTPRAYLPYVRNPGVVSLPIQGYTPDSTTPSGSAPAEPNLRPYAPAGWGYPVVPSSTPGSLQLKALIASPQNYFSWTVINEGNTVAVGSVYTCLYLDGAEIGRWRSDDQPKRSYAYVRDWLHAQLSPGAHTISIQADCTGVVAESNESDNQWSRSFTWQLPVLVSGQQGLDTCTAPTIDQMRAWWQFSPYYDANIYIGGISRGCGQPALSAAWVQTVTAMGWRLIPTWVGPQAPCSTLRTKHSSSTSTAYKEGRAEADSATTVAGQLGLLQPNQSGTIIYYDMEAFNTTDSVCLAAVQSFINGWVSRMHELGNRAGVYSTSSALSKFYSIPNPPDDIWAAVWKSPYAYDPTVTVWNLPYITNTQWANHQRIRQYTGGHNEKWGGVTLNIDSDVLDGHVAGSAPDPAPGSLATQSADVYYAGPQILDLDTLDSQQGWVLNPGSLLWTTNGGADWRAIQPALSENEQLSSVYFLTPRDGWVVARSSEMSSEATWTLYHSTDGGGTWQATPLPGAQELADTWSGKSWLSFTDLQHGWLVLEQSSSSSFSTGMLFRTVDGGSTWEKAQVPIGDEVKFLTPEIGLTAGGPGGDELYRSLDGGLSWEALALPLDLADGEIPQYSLPIPGSSSEARLPVLILSETNPRLEIYLTRDSGLTWEVLATQPWSADAVAAGWAPAGSELTSYSTQQEPRTSLPEGTTLVDFSDPLNGWALSTNGNCSGQKGQEPLACTFLTQFWITTDGGASWMEASLPVP